MGRRERRRFWCACWSWPADAAQVVSRLTYRSGDNFGDMALDDRHEVQTPLSTDAGRLARTSEVIADVSARLRGVCAHLPEAEFLALVRRIADISVKYEALAELRAARIARRPEPRPPSNPSH